MTDKSIPAFPSADNRTFGMSLRDYFAGQALMEIVRGFPDLEFEDIAIHCYGVADAMLAARDNEK